METESWNIRPASDAVLHRVLSPPWLRGLFHLRGISCVDYAFILMHNNSIGSVSPKTSKQAKNTNIQKNQSWHEIIVFDSTAASAVVISRPLQPQLLARLVLTSPNAWLAVSDAFLIVFPCVGLRYVSISIYIYNMWLTFVSTFTLHSGLQSVLSKIWS